MGSVFVDQYESSSFNWYRWFRCSLDVNNRLDVDLIIVLMLMLMFSCLVSLVSLFIGCSLDVHVHIVFMSCSYRAHYLFS